MKRRSAPALAMGGAILLMTLSGCTEPQTDRGIAGTYSVRLDRPGTLILTKQPASRGDVILEFPPDAPAEVRWRLEFSEEYFPFQDTFYSGEGALHFQTRSRDPATYLSLTGALGNGHEEALTQEGDWSYGFKGSQFKFPSTFDPAPGADESSQTLRGGWSLLTMKGPTGSPARVALVLDDGTWVRMNDGSEGSPLGPQAFVFLLLAAVGVGFAIPRFRRSVRDVLIGVWRGADPKSHEKAPPPAAPPAKEFDPLGRKRQKNN